VTIAMGYRQDCRVSIPGRDKIFFSTPQRPKRFWAHPTSYPVGIGNHFFLRVKWPGRNAHRSHLSSAEVENAWSCTSALAYVFTAFRPALGPTQSPIQWILGALPMEVKRPVREADDPPPSSWW
jgi:hypothetical protein